jgi:MFS superfamily sulfate permease-like transporter
MLLNSPLADIFKQQYKIIYSSMLKIALLNLSNSNKKNKVIELIDFMANDIKAMDVCLLEIAAVYFVKKQNLLFFGKIQKGKQDIINTIKNLSWDIFHLRYQEFLLSVKPVGGIDVNLVLFCTLDKRLIEIQEIIKLKAIAYNIKTGNYYPFYQSDLVMKMLSKEEIHKYFQAEKHFDRISTKMNIDYDYVISNLEKNVVNSYSKTAEGAAKS